MLMSRSMFVLVVTFLVATHTRVRAQTCPENAAVVASYAGDGYCDELQGEFNTMACGWDGGDCCNSTCIDDVFDCAITGFHCLDPNATDYTNGTCTAAGESVGDGFCDTYLYSNTLHLNKMICDWDGGDCCPSTCNGTCDHLVYYCLDPDAVDYGNQSACAAPQPAYINDGYCDVTTIPSFNFNTAVCNWDGGDCCPDTCVDGLFECGSGDDVFVCRDPESANYTELQCTASNQHFLGDGWCDFSDWNTAACGWDGGDCCEDTCVTDVYVCGGNSYGCADPNSTEFRNETEVFDNCTVEYPSYLGDAYCDHGAGYNNMGCGWDGGDCCEDTCEREAAFYNCGVRGYTCLDPNSTNFMVCAALNVNTTLYDNGTNWGNGECDQFNHDLEKHLNSQICAWDGGDCCASTCVMPDGSDCANIVFDCLDPNATDYGSVSTCDVPSPSWIGDAYCDYTSSLYNTEACGWDGGDCCELSCLAEDATYACGSNDYVCIDPLYTDGSCQATAMSWVGDGWCDQFPYNTEACQWDGGDCCEATCQDGLYLCNATTNDLDCQIGRASCRERV